jgi:hypothetical protein
VTECKALFLVERGIVVKEEVLEHQNTLTTRRKDHVMQMVELGDGSIDGRGERYDGVRGHPG